MVEQSGAAFVHKRSSLKRWVGSAATVRALYQGNSANRSI
jgi:hypothetical protein